MSGADAADSAGSAATPAGGGDGRRGGAEGRPPQAAEGRAPRSGEGRAPRPEEAGKERKGGFSHGTNPLLEQSEAYRSGLQYFAYGNTAFVDGSRVQDLQIGTRIVQNFTTGDAGRLGSGPLREDVMITTRATYVPVPGYQDFVTSLRDRHVIVLRGVRGTGRATTAIHLLDEVAAGKVARLAEDCEAEQITAKDVDEGWGYLVESSGRTMREMHLDRLGAILRERTAYCVVVLDTDPLRPDNLGGYVHEHTAPPISEMITSHLRHALHPDGDPALTARLEELAGRPETITTLGPSPHTSEACELASLLVLHGHGTITYEEVLVRSAQLVERQVLEWFEPLRNAERGPQREAEIRMASMRIALAVFSNSPYDVVVESAEKLAQELLTTTTAARLHRRPVFTEDRGSRLVAMRCRLVDSTVSVGGVPVPTQKVMFLDDRYPMAILTYLWQWHHLVRPTLVTWLRELTEDDREFVWVRAAQALSVLGALDFPYVLDKLVVPWADSVDADERMSAAVVLDLAARDERIRPAVLSLVHRWVRRGTNRQRWTAALTQSRDLGLGSLDRALDHLRIVGTWPEQTDEDQDDEPVDATDLSLAASWSVASLFAAGAIEPVVDRLRSWLAVKRHHLRDLALLSILQLMVSRPGNAWAPGGLTVTPGRERWPLLLDLADRDPRMASDFADLIWQTLHGAPAERSSLEILSDWVRDAERDDQCLCALEAFLPLLVDSEAAASRLRHLLRTMRNEWIDPLRADVAARLEQAVDRGLARNEEKQ